MKCRVPSPKCCSRWGAGSVHPFLCSEARSTTCYSWKGVVGWRGTYFPYPCHPIACKGVDRGSFLLSRPQAWLTYVFTNRFSYRVLSRQGVWSALTSAVACGGGEQWQFSYSHDHRASYPTCAISFFNNIFSKLCRCMCACPCVRVWRSECSLLLLQSHLPSSAICFL